MNSLSEDPGGWRCDQMNRSRVGRVSESREWGQGVAAVLKEQKLTVDKSWDGRWRTWGTGQGDGPPLPDQSTVSQIS